MSIKTNELQQIAAPQGADSILLDTAAAGTGRLSLAKAAEFFGAELVKPANPVGAALSNKAAKSVQDTVEATSIPSRTVTLAAADLPSYIDGLPRLLMEDLTISVSGVLTEYVYLNRFFGSGSISIEGNGGCKLQGGVGVNNCSVIVSLRNLELSGHSKTENEIVSIKFANRIYMSNCTFTGSRSADSEGEVGMCADVCSFVRLSGCGISNCKTAVLVESSSIVSVYNNSGDGFSGNATGPYVYHGGIILLSGSTPDLLGGTTSAKGGGLIVKGDGTLL